MKAQLAKKVQEVKNIFVEKPYRIGIAMSGGGIKGLAHAGALKALEEYGVKPDIISGVSAGSIVGALYADGYSPDEIAEIFYDINFRKMTKLHRPDGGIFKTDPFEKYLKTKLHAKTFEELKIPLRIVATNLDKGQSVVFSKGNLVDVIMASSSMPVIFSPRKIEGENYVDGGVFKNFPVTTIRNDCEKIIGINVSPLVAADYKLSLMNVAFRCYNFMFKANSIQDKLLCDLLIEPIDIENYDTFDTAKSREIFNIGYKTAQKILKTAQKER